jgi:hypothetical protein
VDMQIGCEEVYSMVDYIQFVLILVDDTHNNNLTRYEIIAPLFPKRRKRISEIEHYITLMHQFRKPDSKAITKPEELYLD